MHINSNVRNVAIILVIAALVVIVPGGGPAANTIMNVIYLAFLGAISWVASRLYREHRGALYSLGDRRRTVLYIAVGVATLTFCATGRLWGSGIGSVAWLVLLAAAAYAVFEVFRSAREY